MQQIFSNLFAKGRVIYAVGLFGLAVLGALEKDFVVGRPPALAQFLSDGTIPAYLVAIVFAGLSICVLIDKKVFVASVGIAIMIIVFSFSRHLTQFSTDWLNGLKALALTSGAMIIATVYSNINMSHKQIWITIAIFFMAAFFIGCGYAHFKFAEFVEQFIPAYIPFRKFWTYFCGICLVAGGIGILVPVTRMISSFLSGAMVMGWFILLHIPRVVASPNDLSERLGLFESFAIAGIFFYVTGMLARERKLSRQQIFPYDLV